MWLGAAGVGVFEFHAGEFIPLEDAATKELLQDPHCLLVDKAGRIWIGAGDDFVLCRDGNRWRPYQIPRHLARSFVSSLVEEPDGSVWAGSASEGLFEFKDGRLITINASSGLSDNSVESLLVDRDGNLWAGTDAGLNLLRQKDLFAFDQRQGLGYGAVEGLAEVAPGVIWVGKPSDGLYRGMDKISARSSPPICPSLVSKSMLCLSQRTAVAGWPGRYGLLHFKNPTKRRTRRSCSRCLV